MKEVVEDLRILRLAQMYEETYERFVRESLSRAGDPETTRDLASLQPPADTHRSRLAAHAKRLQGAIAESEEPEVVASALADIVEIERAAREFYFQSIDRVHDPELAKLFHDLAHEEGRHVETAERALDQYRRRKGIPPSTPRAPENGAVMLWEGAGDLGRATPR